MQNWVQRAQGLMRNNEVYLMTMMIMALFISSERIVIVMSIPHTKETRDVHYKYTST